MGEEVKFVIFFLPKKKPVLFLIFRKDFERRQRDSSQAQTGQQQQQPQEKRRPRRRTVDFYIRAPKKRAMTAADYYNGDDADYAYDVVRSRCKHFSNCGACQRFP